MSKKIIYLVSALAMLVLAIAIGILFSQSVPVPLTEEAHRIEETKNIEIAPLAPIENLITHSAEGDPIATTTLADKYAQAQQELALPPDISSMDFSAHADDIDMSIQNPHNSSLESENIETVTQQLQNIDITEKPDTEKNKAEFDAMLAEASEKSSSTQIEKIESDDLTLAVDINNTKDRGETAHLKTPSVDISSSNKESTNKEDSKYVEDQKEFASDTETQKSIDNKPNSLVSTTPNIAHSAQQASTTITPSQSNIEASADKKDTPINNNATSTTRSDVKIPKLKANALVTSSSLEAIANANVITNAKLSMDGDQVHLQLVGNKPLQGTSFILDNPDRIVFDISGIWKMTVPRLISNRMVRDLRLGQTNTKTRLVFDMKVSPKSSSVLQVSDNEIVLIFK